MKKGKSAIHRNILYNALMGEYDDVRLEYRIPHISTRIQDYVDEPYYDALKSIYDLLFQHDKSKNAERHNRIGQTGVLEDCDIVLIDRRQIIEYDEKAHLTTLRKATFALYPNELELGFNKLQYAQQCKYSPRGKSIASIWYDVLRDFLPLIKGFNPTIRIIDREADYEGLSVEDQGRAKILERLNLKTRIAPKCGDRIVPSENFDEHKNQVYLKAFREHDCACWSYPLLIPAKPSHYSGKLGSVLQKIFSSLESFCESRIELKKGFLAACDIYIPKIKKVIELDEKQHFSLSRAKSLRLYDGIKVDYSVDQYISFCQQIKAHDRSPIYRDGQRAWLDCLRDHIPSVLDGFQPTQRYAMIEENK